MTRTVTHRPLLAALWMGGAVLCFSVMAVAGREVSHELDPFEIMACRSAIGLVLVLAVALAQGRARELAPRHLGLHFGRNLVHFTGQILWFYALTLIPLAQLFALEFSYPILVALLAPFFLGERLTARRLAAAAAGFAGILIVARPFGAGGLEIGLVAALASALGFAGSAIITKRMTARITVAGILVWLSVFQLLFGLAGAAWDGDVALPSAPILPWVLVIGLAGIGAHLCLTTALSLAPASVVTPIDFLRLPLIGVVGMMLYHEPLDFWVFLGGAVIFAANWMNLSPARPAAIVAPAHPDATSSGKAD